MKTSISVLNFSGFLLFSLFAVTLERTGKVAAIHRRLRVVQHNAGVGQAPTRIRAFQGRSDAGANSEDGIAS